ncbi:MAG: methyltransferase domain-containing protein, partial [Kofleriaceae bacterium]
RRACEHRAHSVRFHHASAVALPFEAGRFTHALCLEAAHHFDTREAWLREAYRVLAPGGRLAMADFAIVRPPRGPWQRATFGAVLAAWSVPRANAISPDLDAALLREIGFVDVELELVGDRTFPGYWREQRRLERRHEVRAIRGRLGALIGVGLNYGLNQLYEQGWAEYALVAARKRA